MCWIFFPSNIICAVHIRYALQSNTAIISEFIVMVITTASVVNVVNFQWVAVHFFIHFFFLFLGICCFLLDDHRLWIVFLHSPNCDCVAMYQFIKKLKRNIKILFSNACFLIILVLIVWFKQSQKQSRKCFATPSRSCRGRSSLWLWRQRGPTSWTGRPRTRSPPPRRFLAWHSSRLGLWPRPATSSPTWRTTAESWRTSRRRI